MAVRDPGLSGRPAEGDISSYVRQKYNEWYQSYLERIKQYEGTSFYQQLLNNPYAQYQDYGHSWLEGVWSNITGSYGGADKFLTERFTSADEYFSQVLDTMRQQAYNDPSAQVAREKAAGLNPDLNGGAAIDPGQAGEAVPDDTPPAAPDYSSSTEFGDVASLGMNFFSQVMSMGSFIQEMAGKNIQNAAADIALTDQGYDSLVKMMAGSSSLPSTIDEYENMSEEDRLALDQGLIKELDAAISSGQLKGMYDTKRARRLVKMLRGTIAYDKNGKPTLAYETYRSKLLAERYKSHEATAGVLGNLAFSEDLGEFGSNIAEIFGKVNLAILEAEKKMKEAQAKYQSEYANTIVDGLTPGVSDAQADIAGNTAEMAQAEYAAIKAELDKQMDAMFSQLQEACKGDKWYHVIGKMLVPVARALVYRLLNGSISFGSSSGPKGRVANSTLSF